MSSQRPRCTYGSLPKMQNMKIRVLIIIPAYNEQENLEKTIAKVKFNAPFADVLVVDDGSVDETPAIANKNGVKVISLPFNLGIGGAVQTGFKYALRRGYDVVVQVDADGQHDPVHIPKLVDHLLAKKLDIVIGSRFLNDDEPEISLVRNFGIKYFSWLTSKILKQKITDCSSGFRALSKNAIQFFSENYPVDFPDAEALILAYKAGLKMEELPVKFRNRMKGKSSLHILRLLYYPLKETLSIINILTKREKRHE